METWYKLEVGDGTQAYGPSLKAQEDFFTLVSTGSSKEYCAIFSYYDLTKKLITWYFTPDASNLATLYRASACEKPEPQEGFSLLVGNNASWNKYFPDHIK